MIKWKGFTEDECTWEPLSNLDACAKMIAKFEKEHGATEEKVNGSGKNPKPEKKQRMKAKEDISPEINIRKDMNGESKKNNSKGSQIEEEKFDTHLEVLKRTSIDSEIVFKVIDQVSKKEQFMSRKELLKEDPVALCLFYEKHIVS